MSPTAIADTFHQIPRNVARVGERRRTKSDVETDRGFQTAKQLQARKTVSVPEYWWPYLYQYGVGLAIFVIGLILIIKYKACVLSRSQDRFWFGVLIFGFIWYAGMHLI